MEHWTEINGLKIRYLQKGEGYPFVLLHGFSFHAETWVEIRLFDELAKNYSVYSFDMPYGIKSVSDKFDTTNRDEYAEFLLKLLQKLKIDTPYIVSASISGEVTLRYLAKNYPAKAAIVVGPANIKNLIPLLDKINVPVLAIWGDKDNISSSDNSTIFSEKVKESEIYIIKDAGHACYLDKPEEFKKELYNFLKKFVDKI